MGEQSTKQWSRITLSTDGRVIHVRHNNVDMISLSNMLYAVLNEIPHAPYIMHIVLEKYNQEHEKGLPGT